MNNNSQPMTIGSHTSIDIPKFGIKNIPAKVDTGADSSSVWASQIKEEKGKLTFCLFDKGLKFYNGKEVSTKDYKIKTIRNSFGHTEFRYSVKLSIIIEGRTIKATFTLADRSNNRYPILIGRRTLQGKFLVDVSRTKSYQSRRRKVLVVGTKPGESLKEFLGEVSKQVKGPAVSFTVRSYNEIAFHISTKGVRVYETSTGKDVSSYDLVYFKSHKRSYPLAISLATYLEFCNINFIDREILHHVSYDKLSQYIKLAQHGLPIPATLSASKSYLKDNYTLITKKTGWPVVCKEINSDKGRKNFLVNNATEIKEILSNAETEDIFLIQQFIPSNGYLRVAVMGSEVPYVISRSNHSHKDPKKQHLNNPAGSANAKLVSLDEIDSTLKNTAVMGAKLMNRQSAGVDLIQDEITKDWFILEVNSAPQLRSGAYLDVKRKAFAKFIDNELNR